MATNLKKCISNYDNAKSYLEKVYQEMQETGIEMQFRLDQINELINHCAAMSVRLQDVYDSND